MATLTELRNEHELVILKMDVLKQSINLLVAGQITEAEPVMRDCANFIKNAILPHFDLEEKVIFPFLAKHSEESRGLATELLEEHIFLRGCFDRYFELMKKDPSDSRLQETCHYICSKLPAHAHKEDAVLIPLIKDCFGVTEDDELPEHAPTLLYEDGA